MKSKDKIAEKSAIAQSVNSIVKKLKRVRSQVVLFEMKEHLKAIDKNISDLTKLRKKIERHE